MKVGIIEGSHDDKCYNACYDYLVNLYMKEMERQCDSHKQNDSEINNLGTHGDELGTQLFRNTQKRPFLNRKTINKN